MSEMDAVILMEFLRDESRRELHFKIRDYEACLMKGSFDKDTDFLYLLEEYRQSAFTVGGAAKYAGVYSRLHDRVYDLPYSFYHLWEEVNNTNHAEWYRTMSQRVIDEILLQIDNKPVEVTDAAEKPWCSMDYFINYSLEDEAVRCFYSGSKPFYTPQFKIDHMTASQFAASINHTDDAVREYAADFIRMNALRINQRLEQIPMILRRLEELESTPCEHHIRRRIIASISDEKMVCAEIEKEGKRLTIRIKGSTLKSTDCHSYFRYSMDTPSRKEFEALYGQCAELWPHDIVSISYGKKILYRKEDADEK